MVCELMHDLTRTASLAMVTVFILVLVRSTVHGVEAMLLM